ncbi:hypothetical protein A6E15_05860 [Natrinema saccharevitans]|uniref:DUF3006 domain-containing protein n=1 Tax=Natrinema saccharevitans TaxID=301967 RepID=A0A1S8AUP5_9EURY|nr:DUF3006 domain-containing protein [Natrinema saccharevitans]OLZ40543.1 hypothetical protein A6E15_05860 [Natrinema saccharevitans]
MSEPYTGVLDRIVDGERAVLLLEDGGDDDRATENAAGEEPGDGAEPGRATVVDELVVGVDALPAEGRHEGAVFAVRVDTDGTLLEASYRADAEGERRASARERFDRLSERLPDE